jgi:transposase
MPKKPEKYIVKLSDEQHNELVSLLNKGEHSARIIKRANILLQSAAGKTAPHISKDLKTSQQTVYNIRKRFVQGGLDLALHEKPRPGAKRKLDTEQEAHVIATACSDPPGDRARWTVRLLTDRIVELGIVDEISRETVRRTLKKTRLSRGRRSSGVYPK